MKSLISEFISMNHTEYSLSSYLLSITSLRFLCVLTNDRIMFLWLDNIYHLSSSKYLLPHMCTHTIFIHSSVIEHLGLNLPYYGSFCNYIAKCNYFFETLISLLLNISPKVGLLGCMLMLFLVFKELLFSILAITVYLPPAMLKETLINTYYLSSFVLNWLIE